MIKAKRIIGIDQLEKYYKSKIKDIENDTLKKFSRILMNELKDAEETKLRLLEKFDKSINRLRLVNGNKEKYINYYNKLINNNKKDIKAINKILVLIEKHITNTEINEFKNKISQIEISINKERIKLFKNNAIKDFYKLCESENNSVISLLIDSNNKDIERIELEYFKFIESK